MEEALLQLTTNTHVLTTAVELVDPLRTIPFRFLGYGAACGEALRGHLPPEMNDLCYQSTTTFVFSHAAFCGFRAITNGDNFFEKVLDTVLFDTIATVFFPMLIGSRVRSLVKHFIRRRDPDSHPEVVKYLPSVAALSAVFLFSKPIDTVTSVFVGGISSGIFQHISRPKIKKPEPVNLPMPPVAPIVPITLPAVPEQKPVEKKESLSVVISGEPGYKFDVNIRGRNGSPFLENSEAQASPKSHVEDTSSTTPPKSTRSFQQKYLDHEESRDEREPPGDYSPVSRGIDASSPSCPRMFKNFRINLSSKSPLRAIYRDPYEEGDDVSSRSRRKRTGAGRQSYVESFDCECVETEGFECSCSPSGSTAIRGSSWNYDSSHYTKPADSRQNSAATYADRNFD